MPTDLSPSQIFSRVNLLLGRDATEALAQIRVVVFGVGGVGSWCAESLVRTGVTNLTIVDCDAVAPSNINRQLMATTLTVGQPKVEALRNHLLTINPHANITARQEVYSQHTARFFDLNSFDYIVDAIDSIPDKMLLIENATHSHARLFSSMGAALKLDPTRIRTANFEQVKGCPLARALRQRFKKENRWPKRKFTCVYSDELLPNKGETAPEKSDSSSPLPPKLHTNGSLMHITAIFGLTLAGLIIAHATQNRP